MKFIRFLYSNSVRYGELNQEEVHEWSAPFWLDGIKTKKTFLLSEVKLLAPCEPTKIIATAINYPGATGSKIGTREPLVFFKPASSIANPEDIIVSPFSDIPVWGECELGVVLGKKLKNASKDEVQKGIAGYTIGNDVSADNINEWDHHLARSKGADTFCPLGPWIDTDFNPQGKSIQGFHNGELLREGILSDRLFAEPELIVWLSSWITLLPGDVILTGAPTRVRERIFFKSGDEFVSKIEGLGELRNTFRYMNE